MLDVELTSREIDVLWLITQGCTDDEITDALDIFDPFVKSLDTINVHTKMHVQCE